MKVCFTTFDDIENDGRVNRELSTLKGLDYDMHVICGSAVDYNSQPESLKDLAVERVYLGTKRAGKLRFLKFYLKTPLKAIRAKADIYHAQELYSLPVAWIGAIFNNAPLIYDSHEYYPGMQSLVARPLERSVWSLVERIFIKRAQTVITVSDAISEKLSKRYRIPPPVVIRNCHEKKDVKRTNLLRERFSIGEDRKILLYQGIMSRGRGLFTVLESLKRLPQCAFVALGDGPLLKQLEEYSQQHGLSDRTFFPGCVPVEELIDYTASADIGLCIIENVGFSYYNSLPNKLFEYMMAGIPTVASDFPEIGKIVKGEGTGLVVDPDDPDAIAKAVTRLLSDRGLYDELSANALSASKRHNWEEESKKLAQLYRAI